MPIKNLTIKSTILMVLIFILTSCGFSKTDPQDPYEKYNRQIFRFNMAMDKAVLRPIAKGYNKAVPQYVQARVTNFFNNFNEVATIANDVLQFQVYYTFNDTSRFLVNSTLGIFGLYDVATKMDLPAHANDFGLTLLQYGMKKSPYIMIPVLGPSTVRDEIGTTVDYYGISSWAIMGWYVPNSQYYTYPMYGLYKINQRASLLPVDKLVDEAFDPYVFVRNAYLQSRNNKIKELRNIEATNGINNQDTFVAGDGTTTTNGTTTDNKDTFVPAGDETSSDNATANDSKDTFVPAGDEKKDTRRDVEDPIETSTDKNSHETKSTQTQTSSKKKNHHHHLAAKNSAKKHAHHHYAQKSKKPERLVIVLPPS